MISNYKKIVSILLVTLLLASFAFTACGKNNRNDTGNDTKQNRGNESTLPNNSSEETFSYPVEGNKKLTYWVGLNGQVAQLATNLADTPFAKALEEKTGVSVKYQHPAADQAAEAFSLLVASGEYPDIVEYDLIRNYQGGPEKAIMDGFIIELNDKLKSFAPNLTRYYEENPLARKMVMTDSGKFYNFPFIRGGDPLMVYFGPIVRKDWLDDLSMAEPETMDEWYNMLTAFKEEKGASAPLSFQEWMLGNGSAFMGAYGVARDFYLGRDGKVKFGQIEPGYKEFLVEFSKWYREGLLDADLFTVNGNQVAAKITGGDTGASLGYQASGLGNLLRAMEDDPGYDLAGVKYPVLNKGETPMFSQKDIPVRGGGSAYITTDCKDVEAAMRFLDYGYTEEGHMLFNFGIEGTSYDMIDGYPTYTELIMNNPDYSPAIISKQYIRASYSGPFVQDVRYFEQYGYTFEQQRSANANWGVSDIDKYRLPPVTPSTEESQEVATIMGEINTYTGEMFAKYLLGQESIDNFDKYVKNIKNMGIDRVIEIKEAALRRYNNR